MQDFITVQQHSPVTIQYALSNSEGMQIHDGSAPAVSSVQGSGLVNW